MTLVSGSRLVINGGNEGAVGTGRLSGSRVGDRCALALISLALEGG
jgi:hypothetical protein